MNTRGEQDGEGAWKSTEGHAGDSFVCIWIGTSVVSPKEDGEGFKIIGIRFLIGGIVSITLAFIAKYFLLIKYLLKQISYKGKSGDKFSDWHKP